MCVGFIYVWMRRMQSLFSHTQILFSFEYLYKFFNFPTQYKLINRSKVHTI